MERPFYFFLERLKVWLMQRTAGRTHGCCLLWFTAQRLPHVSHFRSLGRLPRGIVSRAKALRAASKLVSGLRLNWRKQVFLFRTHMLCATCMASSGSCMDGLVQNK